MSYPLGRIITITHPLVELFHLPLPAGSPWAARPYSLAYTRLNHLLGQRQKGTQCRSHATTLTLTQLKIRLHRKVSVLHQRSLAFEDLWSEFVPETQQSMFDEESQTRTSPSSIYKPLNSGSIRVLQLQPADSLDSPLIATLDVVVLSDRAGYDALSYAWDGAFTGHELPDGSLCLNGNTTTIKGNLRDALRRLRRKNRVRTLWVDAVCIHQEDLSERSAQVAIMAQIYSAADQVIMWVGEDSVQGDGKVFFDWCRRTAEIRSSPWSRTWRKHAYSLAERVHLLFPDHGSAWFHHQHLNYPVLSWEPDKLRGLIEIFHHRRYFDRRWCIQETAYAKQVLLTCGPQEVLLTELGRGIEDLPPQIRPHLLLQSSRSVNTLRILQECFRLQCRDERDRIYALAGLLQAQLDCPAITIDYTSPWPELYAVFTRSLVEGNGSVLTWRLLILAGSQQIPAIQERRFVGFPSWMPDWRLDLRDREILDGEVLDLDAPAERNKPLVLPDGMTLSLRLGYHGVMGAVRLEWFAGVRYLAEDRIYGLDPRFWGKFSKFQGGFVVLRALYDDDDDKGGRNGMVFRLVGSLAYYHGDERPEFEGVHHVFIR